MAGAVKAWALRRFGKQIGDVTPAQLRALAVAALRDQQTGGPTGGTRLSTKQDTFAAEFMTELAAHDELFRHPRSDSRTLEGVMADVFPEAKLVGEVTSPDERQESGADQRFLFRPTTARISTSTRRRARCGWT